MIKYDCEKIYGGRVSVRNYMVKLAKRTHQKLLLTLVNKNHSFIPPDMVGQQMTIDEKTPYTCDERTFNASYPDIGIKKGEAYQLWDYWWETNYKEPPQDYTGEGLSKLHEAMAEFFKPKPVQMKVGDIK